MLLKRREKFVRGERRILKSKTLLAQCLTANRRRHIDLVVDEVIGVENVDAVWREHLLGKVLLVEGHYGVCVAPNSGAG